MANDYNPFQVLAERAGNHLRIIHNAKNNMHRAAELLEDRMLDFLNDYTEGDEKDPDIDKACEAICALHGPLIRLNITKWASAQVEELRRRVEA